MRPSCHFRHGYEQAFIDIAEGGTGITPAVPPERYWSFRFRTAGGHAAANDWFQGYSTGASVADQEGLRQYNSIPISGPPLEPGGAPAIGNLQPVPPPAYAAGYYQGGR